MKTALLFGSSGLIGGHLLKQLINNDNYSEIKLFVRSIPEIAKEPSNRYSPPFIRKNKPRIIAKKSIL